MCWKISAKKKHEIYSFTDKEKGSCAVCCKSYCRAYNDDGYKRINGRWLNPDDVDHHVICQRDDKIRRQGDMLPLPIVKHVEYFFVQNQSNGKLETVRVHTDIFHTLIIFIHKESSKFYHATVDK